VMLVVQVAMPFTSPSKKILGTSWLLSFFKFKDDGKVILNMEIVIIESYFEENTNELYCK